MLPALVIHGGAGDVDDERALAKLKGVQIAARAGWRILNQPGGSALDAVEAAVRVMEDDTSFNAGSKHISKVYFFLFKKNYFLPGKYFFSLRTSIFIISVQDCCSTTILYFFIAP